MPDKDLGSKHLCFKCGTKFYDLKKPEPICPKCGADQRQSPALKAPASEKRSRPPPRPAAPPPPAAEEPEAAELDEEVEDDDEDEDDDDDEP